MSLSVSLRRSREAAAPTADAPAVSGGRASVRAVQSAKSARGSSLSGQSQRRAGGWRRRPAAGDADPLLLSQHRKTPI